MNECKPLKVLYVLYGYTNSFGCKNVVITFVDAEGKRYVWSTNIRAKGFIDIIKADDRKNKFYNIQFNRKEDLCYTDVLIECVKIKEG